MNERHRFTRLLPVVVTGLLLLAIIACSFGGREEESTQVPLEVTEVAEEPGEEPGTQLDWTLDPSFGDVELESGFIPDPYSVRVLSGGNLYAGDTDELCRGYVTPQPDLNFYWTGDGGFLRIFFVADESGGDATLVINDALAEWHCNDDEYGLNPGIDFDSAPSGWYSIWIGSYQSDEIIAGTVYFTELDITPDDVGETVMPPAEEGESTQWAIRATASTEYSSPSWSAMQATGEPDTFECGDISSAWASATSTGVDWLRLEYATPVVPTGINIYQTYNPDAVYMIEVIDTNGETYTVYEADPVVEDSCPLTLMISVSGVDAPVDTLIVHIDQSDHSGWNEIDAVALVGTAP